MRYSKLVLVLFSLSLLSLPNLDAAEEFSDILYFKDVVTDVKLVDKSQYALGKEHYPEYSYHGLPGDFLIKKAPDISFDALDIKSVTITREPYVPKGLLSFTISFVFNDAAGKRLYAYTKENLGRRKALQINRKILVIAKILNPIRNEMNLTVGRKTPQEIQGELASLCKNIIIKGVTP